MKLILLLLLTCTLSGCILTGLAAGAVSPKIPDIDAQIGKENHQEENLVKVGKVDGSTNQEAGSISNTTTVPWWALVITAVCGILVNPIPLFNMYMTRKEAKHGRKVV